MLWTNVHLGIARGRLCWTVFVTSTKENTRICISYAQVGGKQISKLHSSHSSGPNIDIDLSRYKRAVDHDIGLHVDTMLAGRAYDPWPETLKKEARGILIEKSEGM
jgi:hypothetical protein